jgi:hypothetical protein
MTSLGKVLPMQVSGEDSSPIVFKLVKFSSAYDDTK